MVNNILVVAPHADDEVLGCGGTISMYTRQGKNVYVAVMTNANVGAPEIFTNDQVMHTRKEAQEAHKLLGVKETVFFDFPAPALDQYPLYKIANSINKYIRDKNIDCVFIPHYGDIHKDHQIIFEASLVACRPVNGCSVKKILAYETLSETEWAKPVGSDVFIPNVFISISDEDYAVKLNSMKCFKTQLKEFPNPRSIKAIGALSNYRGSTVNENRAESFILIREVM